MGLFEKETPVEERVLDLISGNEDYADILREMVAHEEQNLGEHENWSDRRAYDDTAWSVAELPGMLNPGKLGHMKQKGVIEQVMKTNNTNIQNLWALTDREATKKALRINQEGDIPSVEHEKTEDADIPDDIFSPIVGHEDVKELFLASVYSDDPVHILLAGPPACGKTVFLEEVARLPGSEYLVGSSTTGPGLMEELFDKQPKNILIDEFDKMEKADYGNLLSLQESGLVKETKGNAKRREMKLEGATVYATANRLDKVPSENLSRFLGDPVIRLEGYDDDDFRQVAMNVLSMREGASEEIAELIADIVVEETDVRDFRECRRIFRLASSRTDNPSAEDVRKYVGIINNYSAKGLL